ncbi:MAG: NAD(+) synthase [Alphaproteobacteria bacterium]|nr:NAD(+) synthase [Alphaproteobacteria bacterium]
MRVYNPKIDTGLSPGLSATLDAIRARRGFVAAVYVAAKSAVINDYMSRCGLGGCVIGVSGGVDSALVLALLAHAQKQEGSPIRRILPMLMPIHTSGASNQDRATARGRELLESLGLAVADDADLTLGCNAVQAAVDKGTGMKGEDWAAGQLVSYLRTPALYYASSLLSEQGCPALVVGTTNRDEGAYLGFFGKASDAMVDFQPISDIHKSEVYAAAAYLGVPESILQAVPTGDMFDSRADTDVFGAPYDFVELFLALKCLTEEERAAAKAGWSAEDAAQFAAMSENLEHLHGHNAHKYTVGSPAVHPDIYPSAVPGGWRHGPKKRPWCKDKDVDRNNFVAPFEMPQALLEKLAVQTGFGPVHGKRHDLPEGARAYVAEGLLERQEAAALLEEIAAHEWLPANIYGKRGDFNPASQPTGSWRASSYSPALADILWQRLEGVLPALEHIPPGASVDAQDAAFWRAVGVSPLFRFIKYAPEGKLVAHYDAPFDFGDGRRTLKSMVVYLTDGALGDATRFLKDPQENTPPLQRDYGDWDRQGQGDEILLSVSPSAGSALIFGHRLLHDSAPVNDKTREKIIMRADIVYEKVSAP